MKLQLSKLTIIASAATLAFAPFVHSQTTAYVTTGTETDNGATGLTGIEFTLNMNINVTSLGFSALSLNEGGDTPQVTIWQVGSGGALTQLYTTGNIISTIAADNTNENLNQQAAAFTFVPVTGTLSLSSGDTYLVTAPSYWGAAYNSSGITVAGGGVFSSTSLVSGPGWNGWDNSSYLGSSPNISSFSASPAAATPAVANFQFTAGSDTSVPEPSTYALLGAGVGLLVLHLRRRGQVSR